MKQGKNMKTLKEMYDEQINEMKMKREEYDILMVELKSLKGKVPYILVERHKKTGKYITDMIYVKNEDEAIRYGEISKQFTDSGVVTSNMEHISIMSTKHDMKSAWDMSKKDIDSKTGKLPKGYKNIFTF